MKSYRLRRVGDRARHVPFFIAVSVCLALCVCPFAGARAQAVRTQSIDLQPGWNAVYLEVDPQVSEPAELFAQTPVDIVAAYMAPGRGAQFVRNPSADMLSAYGWAVWYAPSRADAFLSTLHAIYGATPYLIHATTNVTLSLSGPAAPLRLAWTPDAYNFVGFPVQDPGAPTFQQFFAGSPAHQHNNIYRLVKGVWRQVLNPGSEAMRQGEAFWIHCRGRSDYTGPLEVSAPSVLGVNLTSRVGSELLFRNRTSHPVSFRVEHLVDPALPIPIGTTVRAVSEDARGVLELRVDLGVDAFVQEFPPVEGGKAIRLPLALRVQEAGPGERHSLLRVITDLGTIIYVPVTAGRDDLL